jgi:hypothetical protein
MCIFHMSIWQFMNYTKNKSFNFVKKDSHIKMQPPSLVLYTYMYCHNNWDVQTLLNKLFTIIFNVLCIVSQPYFERV